MEKKFGINIYGYINGEFGLGEAVRLLISAIESASIPYDLLNFDILTNHQHNDLSYSDFKTEGQYSINLVLLGPAEAKKIITHSKFNETNFKNKYNIFYLNWESEYFPEEYVKNLTFYDEIWFPSRYCEKAISKYFSKPTKTIPYPIEINISPLNDVEYSNFFDPNTFNFLFLFDYNSTLERKNTINLIKCFKKTFEPNDKRVALTIKTSRSTRFKSEKNQLLEEIGNYENIILVENIFEKNTLHHIIKNCDCYISLHRSEGYGLTMAEAMYFGKPVIATGYSGNLEFMNSENSFLVDYEICNVNAKMLNYDENTVWSNPDIEHASQLMKDVFDNPSHAKEIGEKAKSSMLKHYSKKEIGTIIHNEISSIYNTFNPNEYSNIIVDLVYELEKCNEELYLVRKSKLIQKIIGIKKYLRNRKNKRK